MTERPLTPRLRDLPLARLLGREVPVATGFRARFLGLAHLDRREVGVGLLIPRCSSVHTFGMRFPLDLYCLDERGAIIRALRDIPPRRVVFCRGADAILEVPAGEGGEFSPPGT